MIEPRWLQEKRTAAAKIEAALPLPTHEEYWRKINLNRIKLERFSPAPFSKNGAQLGSASQFLPVKLLLSGEMLYGEQTSQAALDADTLKRGVILSSLTEASEKNEALVSKYLGKGFQGRKEKFIAQNEACWQSGIFCYIPKNTGVELPLLLASHFGSAGKNFSSRLLIVLDQGAQATLVHYGTSSANEGENFLNLVCEIYLEEGASLNFIDLQDLSLKTYEIATKRIEIGRDAKLKWMVDLQGSKLSKTNMETVLNGEGSRAEVLGLMCGREQQNLEICAITQHRAPHTSADILIKGTADDRSKIVFQGMIRIEKEAQQTESYMANHNLVLGDKAHADSIPRLEIEADDVKASHGSTTGQMDPEQFFYLRSKGLSKEIAERLLVDGFYEDIFGRIPVESLRELLRKNNAAHG